MRHPNFPFLRAVGMMIGATVGVGIFGLPYAFAQSGFALGLLLLVVLGSLLLLMQLMFTEVVLQTSSRHRVLGYIRLYLGKRWSHFILAILLVAIWGALTAYLIVGGDFLHLLFSPVLDGPRWVYALLLALVSSVFMYRGVKQASRVEMVVLSAMGLLFLLMIAGGLAHFEPQHFLTLDWGQLFVPYGVILFSFGAVGIIPEMKMILGRRAGALLPASVCTAVGIIAVLYLLFTFAVLGATGTDTHPIALLGLLPVLGKAFVSFGALLGAVTIFSIFMILGLTMLNMLHFDYHLPRPLAWGLVVLVPLLLYLGGLRDFIPLISFLGAIFSACFGLALVATYERMRRSSVCVEHKCFNIPSVFSWLIVTVFIIGMVLEIGSLLS